MDSEEKVGGETVITGNFEVAMTLTGSRTLKISGYIFNKDSAHDVNARVNAMQDVIDLQSVRADVTNKEAQLATALGGLDAAAEFYSKLVADRDAGKKLPTNVRQQIDNYEGNVRAQKATIESLNAAIAAGKKRLNGAMA